MVPKGGWDINWECAVLAPHPQTHRSGPQQDPAYSVGRPFLPAVLCVMASQLTWPILLTMPSDGIGRLPDTQRELKLVSSPRQRLLSHAVCKGHCISAGPP